MPILTSNGRPAVPVVMYHKVGAPVSTKLDRFLNVSATDFLRQMRLLKRLGYQGITQANMVKGLNGTGPLPRKPICITFDDGYQCVSDYAAPILAELSWPATVFVPTASV